MVRKRSAELTSIAGINKIQSQFSPLRSISAKIIAREHGSIFVIRASNVSQGFRILFAGTKARFFLFGSE